MDISTRSEACRVNGAGNFLAANMTYIIIGIVALMVIMYGIIIYLYMNLSYMKKRYRKMMQGTDGGNIERMLLGHIDETKRVAAINEEIQADNRAIHEHLNHCLCKVGVVRFRAFEDMGSDLSYAVALLDAGNNGVIFSSIFGREDCRSYVKPIHNATSTYQLTAEEQQAMQIALDSGK